MTRLHLLIVAGWLLMFGAGFAAGRLLEKERIPPESTYLRKLAVQYDLTPDQVREIDAILADEGAAIDRILARVEADVRGEIQAARAESEQRIRDRLDDTQRRRFDLDQMDHDRPNGG